MSGVCMHVGMWMKSSVEIRRRCQIPGAGLEANCELLSWVLGTELWSPAGAEPPLNEWAISPASYPYSWELPVQLISPFTDGRVWSFSYLMFRILKIDCRYLPPFGCIFGKDFSPFLMLALHSADGFFASQESFNSMPSSLSILRIIFYAVWVLCRTFIASAHIFNWFTLRY